MFSKLKALLDSFLEMGVPGYDILIQQDGKPIWRCQNGYSDLENKIPVSGDERYNLYSCSKPVTVTAAMQLWERGLFHLEDPLSLYLPEFASMTVKTEDGVRPAKKQIRMRDLFTMTAGLTYDLHSPGLERARTETQGRCPTRETMKYLAQDPLAFEPGTRYNYSLCHDVLAAAVEVISGEKFEDYVRKHIFEPMGMHRSSFLLPESERDTLAPQYRFENGKAVRIGPHAIHVLGSDYASGGAGLVSTTEDYIRFLEGLRTAQLLKPYTIRLMTTDQLTEEERSSYGFLGRYGYGLGMRCPFPGLPCQDYGWDGAAGAFAGVDPSRRVTLYYAQHLLALPNVEQRHLIFPLLREIL